MAMISTEEGNLPWTGAQVKVIRNLTDYLHKDVIGNDYCYLPKSITLFLDPGLEEFRICEFLEKIALTLSNELNVRIRRAQLIEKLGLAERKELESLLTDYTDTQPWAIYYGIDGGLGASTERSRAHQMVRGVIPCSTMRNHGVAWERSDNELHVCLATTRKEGQDWDWDSDIGHESGHAAFAPVPLYVQSSNLLKGMLHVDGLISSKDLQRRHIARITYAYSEMAVVAIRGERRSTETGTPLGQAEELLALLKFSHDLMPNFGFDRALSAYGRTSGYIDVKDDTEIYQVVIPMLRVIPHLRRIIKSFTAPSVEEFRDLVGQLN